MNTNLGEYLAKIFTTLVVLCVSAALLAITVKFVLWVFTV